jgi:hypothetical protein
MVTRDTVSNVNASDSRCRCKGNIIARDLQLVASGIYIHAVIRPRVTCCREKKNISLLQGDLYSKSGKESTK